jgi:hypothetical protein
MKKGLNRARAKEHCIITTNVVHRLSSRGTFGALDSGSSSMVCEPGLRLRLEPVAKFHLNTQLFNIYSLFYVKNPFRTF